jgi:hypothetical protein
LRRIAKGKRTGKGLVDDTERRKGEEQEKHGGGQDRRQLIGVLKKDKDKDMMREPNEQKLTD